MPQASVSNGTWPAPWRTPSIRRGHTVLPPVLPAFHWASHMEIPSAPSASCPCVRDTAAACGPCGDSSPLLLSTLHVGSPTPLEPVQPQRVRSLAPGHKTSLSAEARGQPGLFDANALLWVLGAQGTDPFPVFVECTLGNLQTLLKAICRCYVTVHTRAARDAVAASTTEAPQSHTSGMLSQNSVSCLGDPSQRQSMHHFPSGSS